MRKLSLLLGLTLFFAFSFLGCNPEGTDGSSGSSSPEDPIKIGAILPLTGDLSAIGGGERRGLLLALDSVKARHPDREVELIIEDFASETKNAVTAANKLLNVNDVDAIITSTTAASEAVTPVVDPKEIPHFVISPDLDIVGRADNNYRVYYNFRAEANEVNDFLASSSIESMSFLAAQYASIQNEIEKIIEPFAKEHGIEVSSKDFLPVSQNDWRALISKAKSANPDLVFLAPQVNQVESLTTQLFENNMGPIQNRKLVGSFTFNWRSKRYIKTLEDFYIASPKFQVTDTSNVYVRKFQKRFESNPNFDTMYAYDNMIILSDLLMKSEGDLSKFKRLFNNHDEYVGASGKIRFVGNRDTNAEIVLTQIQNGEQVVVGEEEEQGLAEVNK